MEELKTAINAMKTAEEALAKQGFILRWKVRLKTNNGFFRRMLSTLIKDAVVSDLKPAKAQSITAKVKTEKEKTPPGFFFEERKTLASQPKAEAKPQEEKAEEKPECAGEETQAVSPKPEEAVEEEQPVTALDFTGAAAYLGISTPGVYDLVNRKRIPVHGKMGKRWFKVEELEQYRLQREKRKAG